MGTRNLTAVYIDGEYKIAQYGQWDGYPEGQGSTALEFARKLQTPDIMEEFKRKVRSAQWITDAEVEAINAKIKSGELRNWQKEYPELSRDTCAEILDLVLVSAEGIKLQNNLEFAADSLFCEWAWLIDLDTGTFEGYKGFNQNTPLQEADRFYFLKDKESDRYHGILLAAKWKLDELPSHEEFLAAFAEEEDE